MGSLNIGGCSTSVRARNMDVPETMLNLTLVVSSTSMDGDATGDQAARMSTPGAVISGFIFISSKQDFNISNQVLKLKL